MKGSQNGTEKIPKTNELKPKECESEPMDVPKHPLGNRVEQMRKKDIKLGSLFDQKPIKVKLNK